MPQEGTAVGVLGTRTTRPPCGLLSVPTPPASMIRCPARLRDPGQAELSSPWLPLCSFSYLWPHPPLLQGSSSSPSLVSEVFKVRKPTPACGPTILQALHACYCMSTHNLHTRVHTLMWAHVTHLPGSSCNQPKYGNSWLREPSRQGGGSCLLPPVSGWMALSPGKMVLFPLKRSQGECSPRKVQPHPT